MSCIQIDHFSDVLCVWAYVAQIRMEELQSEFGEKVDVDYHFFPVFGDVPGKLEKSWGDRGGVQAYSAHVLSVGEKFEHIKLNPEVWAKNTPQSSLPAHSFLCAVKIIEQQGETEAGSFARYMQAIRDAFFVEARDISSRDELQAIAESLGLPLEALRSKVDQGGAHASVCASLYKSVELGIKFSPTLIFNEGRQKLSGNVGYRIIEANIRELLENPAGQHSWC